MYKLLILVLITAVSLAEAQVLDKGMIKVVGPIPFEQSADSPHLDAIYQQAQRQVLNSGEGSLSAFGKEYAWQVLTQYDADGEGLVAFKMTLSVNRFTQGELQLTGLEKPAVFISGKKVEKGEKGYPLALITGDHRLTVLAQGVDSEKAPQFEFSGKTDEDRVVQDQKEKLRLSMQQLFDTVVISALKLSDDGRYALISYREFAQDKGDTAVSYAELVQLDNMQSSHRWQQMPQSAVFSPDSNSLLYVQDDKLQRFNINTLEVTVLTSELKDASDFNFLDSKNLLFSWKKKGEDDGKLVKRYQSLEDRWSYWRDNSQLYQLDLDSGLIRQLTSADSTTYLLDISEDKKRLLLMRSVLDYSQPPHGKSALYELQLDSLEERLIGEYRAINTAKYSSDGLYVLGGPNFAGGAGVAVAEGLTANDYDGQLYHMDADGSDISALSKSFDPAISGLSVQGQDNLILTVAEQDKKVLYHYNHGEYIRLSAEPDVVKHVAVAKGTNPRLLYAGTTASSPQALYTHTPDTEAQRVWDSTAYYDDTRIPQMQEFDFVNQRGDSIRGRVYLPHDLDETKSYPALVYYYGGTSPVTRAFTGRYPFNLWAAQGYVVYVLQPSGTFGFGQTFSARHVNAWGEYTSDDIIQGTRAFLKAYPMVDSNKVGHLGASYGGFMTMYLATQTDIFAASVSHAGIANIASYWGEGWWGALYSGVASRGSFPWNNPTLYTQQSPLFHAEKITNPMLLIHGDADTNVPPGESQQMYTALKLLGKDVELVEYKGDDHHILTREKTFHWWSTILAYFDMHLKDQPQWWQYLYKG